VAVIDWPLAETIAVGVFLGGSALFLAHSVLWAITLLVDWLLR
jgi:hypothetical protein